MSRLSLAFFGTGVLCALGGMAWGVVMAASNDHTMMPAHAHLNLLGWATMGLMGTFYQLSGRSDKLGWANYWISTLSVVITIPALALTLKGNAMAEKGAVAGSLLIIIGMLTFGASVLSEWRAKKS